MLGLATAVGDEWGSGAADALRFVVGVTATLILLLAITTSFSGAARLSMAMGERLQLPAPVRVAQPALAAAGLGAVRRRRLALRVPDRGRRSSRARRCCSLASIYSFGILIAFGAGQAHRSCGCGSPSPTCRGRS